jgi:hypothetical protein
MGLWDFFNKTKPVQEYDWLSNTPKELADVLLDEIYSNPQSCDKDQIHEGIGEFGLEKTNPVPVFGIPEDKVYLSYLRTKNGEILRYTRTGSLQVDNISKLIDEYEIFDKKGDTLAFICISHYHRRTSQKAPEGFILKYS